MTRVAITGMSVWCSIGRNLAEFGFGLRQGRNGRAPIPTARFDTSSPGYRTRTAAILGQPIQDLAKTDDTILADFAIEVATEALADAHLDAGSMDPRKMGVCLGTSVGGSYAYMKYVKGKLGLPGGDLTAILRPCTSGTIAGKVAKHFGARGPVSVVATACASGTNSVGRAFDLVRTGRVRYMLAGGADLFSELTFSGFNSLQALARGDCRPFDEERDGLMLGDGGAFLVLEDLGSAFDRGARIYGEIAGYAIANEAHHPTGPDPDGAGALSVMRGALEQGGLRPTDVNYINTHGTGTKANDEMELRAIRNLLEEHCTKVYLSSTKSMIGHTLGAAGTIEAVATALGLYEEFVPPSINLRTPMKGYEDFRFVRDRAIDVEFEVALSNSFGFGGNVASVAIRHAPRRGAI